MHWQEFGKGWLFLVKVFQPRLSSRLYLIW